VQVEADPGLQPIADGLQRAAFRRLQPQRVAVDVDALGVAALEPFRAIGVQHRDGAQGQGREHAGDARLGAMPAQVLEDVEERRGRRRLVTVHLRPQQHVKASRARLHHVEGSPLD
jgi:hypothetical protein